ncbi:hypothetical protein EO95_15285 [Methanosarcina sp. 1.H.T.1A.1]|uniref:hypothetical protein n=1 Tax=Methanosarcina sp. 1.H.T.1A.1 TaxID=1483602 RepID=UPI0006222A16|nr:hypothetical protein [Methanosarcina sp. 1.H.T.1A.1]KKH93397.1 hypothetical protein EO95_15285 [Methanosarcina sp. 1.H.T.1A.1]
MAIFRTSGIECGEKSKKGVPCRKFVPEDFKAVQNPIVYYLLPWVPWMSIFIMVLLLIMKNLNFFSDKVIISWLPIIISGYFIAGMSLFGQRLFIKQIPKFFIELWCRKIIIGAFQSRTVSSNINSKDSIVMVSANIQLEERYLQFINEIQKRLNNSWQWLFGIIGFSLTLLWNPLRTLNNFPVMGNYSLNNDWNSLDFWQYFIQQNWHFLNELPVSLIAFMLGLMIWRMYVASTSIDKLVDQFQFEPKLGHQDMSGGLSPLGNLCLWNCTIASLPSIYLSGWLLMGNLNNFTSPYPEVPNYYTYEFLILLLSLSILPIVFCFIRPLWKVHREMNYWRNSKHERLHEVGHLIHLSEFRLLHDTEKIEPEEFELINKDLERMKTIYTQNKKLPIWPFNMKILGKLLATYIIPIVSLISTSISMFQDLRHF